jgi:hypothetical protein
VRHLLFNLEIAGCTQAFNDEIDLLLPGSVNGQPWVSGDSHGG